MNLDSTQEIMDNTVRGENWEFFLEGELLCRAEAPSKTDMTVIESWCNAVRERAAAKAARPTEEEIKARRKRDGSEQRSPDRADAGNSTGSVEHEPDSAQSPVEVRAFEEDPEETARATVERLRDKHQKLMAEAEATAKNLAKWQAILKAIEDTNDE